MKSWARNNTRSFANDKFSAINLSKNDKFQFALSHAQLFYTKNIVYSLIPKNSCTSLRLNLGVENGIIKDETQFDWVHSNYNFFKPTLSEALNSGVTFVILRCPFRRLVSGFLDKFIKMDADAKSLVDTDNINENIYTFVSFVEEIINTPQEELNIHWKPQSCYLLFQKYDFYFSLERFYLFEKWFKASFQRSFIHADSLVDYFNRSLAKVDFDAAFDLSISNIKKLKENGLVPHTRSFYNSYLIDKVSHYFEQDIYIYGKYLNSSDLLFKI